jgi:predicted dinucleotide-binding enzyme
MRIAIVGAGNVGQALGKGWRQAGHEVSYALRQATSNKVNALSADGARVVAMDQASASAEVVVLAVPWPAVAAVLAGLGPLDGKILVDATNPLTAKLELAVGFDDSAGETVARLAPGARVVKAFNTTGAENMANARGFAVKPMMPVAGDDATAKDAVRKLAEELGFEAVDAGPLAMSRQLEPLAVLWIKLAYAQGFGRSFAFALAQR